MCLQFCAVAAIQLPNQINSQQIKLRNFKTQSVWSLLMAAFLTVWQGKSVKDLKHQQILFINTETIKYISHDESVSCRNLLFLLSAFLHVVTTSVISSMLNISHLWDKNATDNECIYKYWDITIKKRYVI